MRVRKTGIDDCDFRASRERELLDRQRRRVEKEGVLPIAETADHLIHDADGRADEDRLGAVAQDGNLEVRQLEVETRP